jgi:hypothetical protein
MYWIMYVSISHKYYLRFLAKDFHNNTLCRKKLEDVKGIRVEAVLRQTDRQTDRQTIQWPNKTGRKGKQWYTKHYTQNTDCATQTSLPTLPEHLSSPPVFSGVRVTRSLALYVCFVNRCLSLCTFSFGHCVFCSSSIYGFWLCHWYRQTLLTEHGRLWIVCVSFWGLSRADHLKHLTTNTRQWTLFTEMLLNVSILVEWHLYSLHLQQNHVKWLHVM